jgi:choline-sulfatase
MRARVLTGMVALLFFTVPRAAPPPSILLITLDTTRADRMGFLGSARGLTPALDILARTAAVFTRAYAQAPITTVSHATILTGTYPPFHHVDDFGAPLPESVPYLPDLFRGQGYRTGAFVGSLVLDPRSGTAPGFDRGFDVYDAGFRLRRPGEDRYQTIERRGDEVTTRALAWLAGDGSRQAQIDSRPPSGAIDSRPRSADAGSRPPYFVWVHLFDPHDPYDPPADLKRRFAAAPYDGEIAAIDRLVGRLVNAVGADTLVAVAADHGEALGDHGEATHGVFLYDETLHVPLVIRFPDRRAAGMRVDARVPLADLAPTLLEAAGMPAPPPMQGRSLLPLTSPSSLREDRPVYAETAYPRRAFGWSPLVAWRADRFLYVRAPTRELYDLVADPRAAHNLAGVRGRVADGLDAELARFLGSGGVGRAGTAGEAGGSGAAGGGGRVDPAVAERLAALGYVGGSGGAPAATGVDPKDRIAIANALHEAIIAVEDGAFPRAIPLLETVTASDPGIPIAQLNLGVARSRQRQYARAVAPLTRAVALQPDDMRAHYELGAALYETGDLKAAAGHFATVTAKMPGWADARYSLGSVYARIDRVDNAVAELRAALGLEPRHFRANLLLGRILTLRGEKAAAVPYLKTAVNVQPGSAEAKQFLADALKK